MGTKRSGKAKVPRAKQAGLKAGPASDERVCGLSASTVGLVIHLREYSAVKKATLTFSGSPRKVKILEEQFCSKRKKFALLGVALAYSAEEGLIAPTAERRMRLHDKRA